ncbi:hypothetical protein FN846DRAFT_913304 [Sphaerosporella brunnea]|uniref:Uncharacterized protein n=1 Tax=Sphaerosporella brunnea TaxID=1250544 RepID=A0A5J5EEH6_9PEZI|nr:hypothetical protein FN846DRAFT_913304 [Sphaerosporella brunnea]
MDQCSNGMFGRDLPRMRVELNATPAMSGEAERVIIGGRYTVTDQRGSLGDDVVEAIQCLQSWVREDLGAVMEVYLEVLQVVESGSRVHVSFLDYHSQLYRVHIVHPDGLTMLGALQISIAMRPETVQKLSYLVGLYGCAPQSANKRVHHNYDDEGDDELSSGIAPTPFTCAVSRPARKQARGTNPYIPVAFPPPPRARAPGPCMERTRPPYYPSLFDEPWQWGPESSAKDVLKMFTRAIMAEYGDGRDADDDG